MQPRFSPLAGPAWAADVVSSNIVGYEKITLAQGYNMIGVQFAEVGGSDKILSTVGELDSAMDGVDEDGDYATTMRVWTGNGYKTYGWSGTGMSENFDDEELDAYKGRTADSYNDDEVAEFEYVLETMKPHEVADWCRSLVMRGINLPDQVKDEAIMIINDARK